MIRIKNSFLFVLLLWSMSLMLVSIRSEASETMPDTYGNRLVAAERYMQFVSMEDMYQDMVSASANNLPANSREEYIRSMSADFEFEPLERASLACLVRHFTVDELNALADFYGSEVGQSAMKKFGDYMGDLLPIIASEMQNAEAAIRAK